MGNGDCTILARPMYKRRKVSAVRDFPEGCIPFASRNDPVLKVDITDSDCANNTTVEDKTDEHLEGGTDKNSKCEKDTQHSESKNDAFLTENLDQTIDCGLKKENSVVSSLQLDEPTLSNDEPGNVPLVGMETSDTEFARTEKSVKHDSTAGEVPMIDGSKPLSSDINVSCSGACMGKAGTRRYLPRKKVSAVREFPPLCGRHAPRLSKDECRKRISSLNNKRAGQQVLAVDDSPLKKTAANDVKESNIQDEYSKRKLADNVQADFEGNAKLPSENKRGKHIALPENSNHDQVSIETKAVVKEESRDAVKVDGTSGLVHYKLKGDNSRLAISYDRKVVLGLPAQSECPWSFDEFSSKSNLFGGTNEIKGRKADLLSGPDRSKTVVKIQNALNHSVQKPLKKKKGSAPSNDRGQLVIWEKKDSLDPNENDEDFHIVPKSHNLGDHENDSNVTRNKVKEALRLFKAACRKLLDEVEEKSNERANTSKRVDQQAAKILKEKGKYVNTGKQILGSVPGVEVGDEFQYRVELNIVGLHRQTQGGIDYVKHNGKVLATSIVASGGYADDMDDSDVLTYTGQGGNVMSAGKEPEDQKLERGNLALKNSSEEKNPVRVIRGSESSDGKCKRYVYDGLYQVESYWQDVGPHGKLVYKFRLRRMIFAD
ncbi:histone-lysine N-methyltransferase, H3 lysine-9 specific SUVH6-like [Lotus japonicus]|uniref:histone-lysine N-methyltransferase, H3 lysine-9 specific SUVH6-like n=1 Tax=Lotus japonicus TaxID=34305 RepID=UPI00258C2987|nr:histone-lysine N-methyltransferase, H3 lysine-9 specific SUVH6-like [Lotus japonicus]